MEPAPLVSIIMPAYNSEGTLAAAVESVLAQTMPRWELLIGDDFSTDRTAEIAASFAAKDPRILALKLDRKGGNPGCARNAFMARAKGERIAFLDSDDAWDPTKLAVQLKLLSKTKRRWAFGNCRIAGQAGEHPSGAYYPAKWRPQEPFFPQLFTGDGVPCLTLISDRSLLEEVTEGRGLSALHRSSPEFPTSADWDITLRLSLRAEPAYSARPLATYFIHTGSFSRNADRTFSTAMHYIGRMRQRGIGEELCTRAERLHRSKRAMIRLFHGGGPWRDEVIKSCLAWPMSARNAFLLSLAAMPESVAKAAYSAAIGARRKS